MGDAQQTGKQKERIFQKKKGKFSFIGIIIYITIYIFLI
jgi:hypothetical protein